MILTNMELRPLSIIALDHTVARVREALKANHSATGVFHCCKVTTVPEGGFIVFGNHKSIEIVGIARDSDAVRHLGADEFEAYVSGLGGRHLGQLKRSIAKLL